MEVSLENLGPKGRQVRVGMGTIPAFASFELLSQGAQNSQNSRKHFGREKQFEIHKIHKNQFKF